MSRRSYRQDCALARTADVVGERWTLLLLRDLLVGPRRYGDLARSLRGIGTNLLARRLKELEADGLLERVSLADGHLAYGLTEAGRALEPALLALVRWGLRHAPPGRAGSHHQGDWDLVALKALFDPARAGQRGVSVQFLGGAEPLWAEVDGGELRVGRGLTEAPDVTLDGVVADLRDPAVADRLRIGGSRRRLRAFRASFRDA